VTTLYYEKNLKTEAPASKASEAGMWLSLAERIH
jgi:hypothetical protein